MPVPLPDEQTRWRCSVCGNLTRFDVLRSSRTQEYVHVDLSGVPTVEDRTVVTETADQVSCRWCGSVDRIELVPRPGATGFDAAHESGPKNVGALP